MARRESFRAALFLRMGMGIMYGVLGKVVPLSISWRDCNAGSREILWNSCEDVL